MARSNLTLMEHTVAIISALHRKFGLTTPAEIIPVVMPMLEKIVQDGLTVDFLELDSYPNYQVGMLDFVHGAMVLVGLSSPLMIEEKLEVNSTSYGVTTPTEASVGAEYLHQLDLPAVNVSTYAVNTLLKTIDDKVAPTLDSMVTRGKEMHMYVLDENNLMLSSYPEDVARRLASILKPYAYAYQEVL